VTITSKAGNAVLMSADEYAALEETAHLLRSPANAERLSKSLASKRRTERDLTERDPTERNPTERNWSSRTKRGRTPSTGSQQIVGRSNASIG